MTDYQPVISVALEILEVPFTLQLLFALFLSLHRRPWVDSCDQGLEAEREVVRRAGWIK